MLKSLHWGELSSSRAGDEHFAFTALLHVCGHICGAGRAGLSLDIGDGLAPLCTICPPDFCKAEYPKLTLVLKLASLIASCNYSKLLELIKPKPSDDQFHYLMRCCLAPALPSIRLDMLKRMNFSWGKGEKVDVEEVSRLLHMSSTEDCLKLCTGAGLPVEEGQSVGGRRIIFHVAAVNENDSLLKKRRDDAFVFGGHRKIFRGDADGDGVVALTKQFTDWLLNPAD